MPLPLAPIIAAGATVASTAINQIGARKAAQRQLKYNKELAGYQADINQRYLREQLAYNSPAQQMTRYKAAGINPNMVISQGNPGNQGAPLSYPEIQAPDVQYERGIGTQALNSILDVVMKSRQAELLESQASLNNVKKDTETINQDLKKVQTAVAQANPLLKDGYVDAMVSQLKAAARLKQQQADFYDKEVTLPEGNSAKKYFPQGYNPKVYEYEIVGKIEQLWQKYRLNEVDQQIRAEILQGKEFNNEILEVQKDWTKNAEVTPQHIYQGIMLLLGKLIGK